MTPTPFFTQSWVNEKRLTAEFYRSFLKMAGLHVFGIPDESTETTKSYTKGGSHMRPRTNFVLALHGECLYSNTYKNAFICFEKHF